MLAAAFDPLGRRVELRENAWNHIKRRHPILRSRLPMIMAAVREPAHQRALPDSSDVWYLVEDAGRFPWLHVVVHYDGGSGWIVTAFPRNALPR